MWVPDSYVGADATRLTTRIHRCECANSASVELSKSGRPAVGAVDGVAFLVDSGNAESSSGAELDSAAAALANVPRSSSGARASDCA